MADLTNSKEATDAQGEGASLPAHAAEGTARERRREVKTVRLNSIDERGSEWADFSSRKFTEDSLNDTTQEEDVTSAVKKMELLTEALTDEQWNGIDLMSRSLPVHNWANFSPVTSSHSKDTSTWAQSTSGDDPFIRCNLTTPCKNSEDGSTSPVWHAFAVRGDHTHRTTPTTPWPETVQSDSNSDRLCNNTCVSAEPYQAALPQHAHYHPCTTVFRRCFANSQTNTDRECSGEGHGVRGLVAAECAGEWQCLKDDSFAEMLWAWAQTSLHHPPPSSCQARLTSVLWGDEVETGQAVCGTRVVSLPLGEEERFDWTQPNQRRRSMSPEVVPNLFRPRKESLVDVDFDHDRAASGLAVLSVVELQKMCDEMTSKFSRLSDELLTNLQSRDVLAGEMEAKNRFVSALLRVQQLRHARDFNGMSGGEPGRGRQWVWGQKKKDDEPSVMYLQAVIPYKVPEGLKWRTDTLTQLTKVLKAMADGSSTVTKLMSEYLQSEFLTTHVEDSLSPDKSTVLSTLSV